jgi:signal transduction histidine kinase
MSLRIRLTLYYGGIFLASSAVLVGAMYFLVRHNVGPVRALVKDPGGNGMLLPRRNLDNSAWRTTIAQLALVFGALSALSTVVGWWLAGRALRPLREIIDVAGRVSEANLHERIALRGQADELGRLAETLDRMLDRLNTVVATQRRFVADASHELRTPLAVMRAGIDVTLTDPEASEDERRAATATLVESIDRSDALIRSMLALARSDQALEERVSIDLAEVVAQSLAEVAEQIDAKGLELRTDLTHATVCGDPALLRTMAANLLRNAVVYNRQRGSLTISVQERQHSATMTVSNTGHVVLDDEVESLFEPFRRSRASRSTGAGLGLAIVKSVVASHGGSVTAVARPAGGLDVEVLLPLDRAILAAAGEPRTTRPWRRWGFIGMFWALTSCGVATGTGYAAFAGALAVARVPVVDRSDKQAEHGAQAFPLVWAGMSEDNVRRVAGAPTWAAPSSVCAFHFRKGIGLAPCWPGQRCLQYGDVDSTRSVEFCFRGGLVGKQIWQGKRWDIVTGR